MANHFVRIQRTFDQQSCTVARLSSLWRYKTRVEDEKDDEVKLPDKLTIRQVLENIENYLRVKRGVTGVFLSYVVRDVVELGNNDLGFGEPTIDAEMVRRAPHELMLSMLIQLQFGRSFAMLPMMDPVGLGFPPTIVLRTVVKRSWPSETTIKAIPIAAT